MEKCKFILAGLFLLVVFTSCRQTRLLSNEKVRLMGAKKLYSMITSNYLPYQTISIKFDAKIESEDVNQSVSGTLRIRKDSVIWISITPALGIEAARLQFTPDSIMFMNRIKNEYFVNPYDYFENKLQTEITFEDLQAIFTNEIFLYSENDDESNEKFNPDSLDRDYFRKTFIATTDSNRYVLKTHRKHKIKKHIKRNKTRELIVETLKIAPEVFKITNVDIEDYTEKRTLNIQYSDFIDVNTKVLPSVINIYVKTTEKNFHAMVKFNKVTVDTDVSFPFKITEKYKRLN